MPKPARSVVAEHIPGEADPRIEIVNGGVAYIGIRHVLVSGAKGRTYHVVELIVSFNGVGFEPVAQSNIQREPAVYLPIVLNIGVHGDGALGTGCIRAAIGSSGERERITGKKCRHAGEDVEAVPVSVGVRIELLAPEGAAHADGVRSLDPGQVVFFRFWTYRNGLMKEAPSGERPIGMAM